MMKLTINANILMAITIVVILFIVIVTVIMVLKEKKKDQKEINDLLTDLRKDRKEKEVIEELEKEEMLQTNSLEAQNLESIEEKQYLKEEEKLEENLKDQSSSLEKKTDIAEMLEVMQEDLDKKPSVMEFEAEQEEKAIISYQELVDSIQNKSPKVEVVDDELDYKAQKNLKQEVEEVINPQVEDQELQQPSLQFIEQRKKDTELPPVEKVKDLSSTIEQDTNLSMEINEENKKDSIKHFKSTDFISPVYGKMNDHLEYPTVPSFDKKKHEYLDDYPNDFDMDYLDFPDQMEINSLEQTLKMPPISTEIKKNDEFLQALKDFRKNLD